MARVSTLAETRLEAKLLDECSSSQGEYLDGHHPPTSFSTRYSSSFVKAAGALCRLYRSQGYVNIDLKMSTVFQEESIKSCRGEVMTEARVKYLLDAYALR